MKPELLIRTRVWDKDSNLRYSAEETTHETSVDTSTRTFLLDNQKIANAKVQFVHINNYAGIVTFDYIITKFLEVVNE